MTRPGAARALVLYFVGEGVQWFSIFLGLSLVTYIYLAARMPTYARLLEKYGAREESAAGD